MKFISLVSLILNVHFATAQDCHCEMVDAWYNYFSSRNGNYKIGDRVNLNSMISKATYFNKPIAFKKSVKGKLIILDFWTTWCGSCISRFREMEQIQKEYDDKIQFFLVNGDETREEILTKFKGNDPELKDVKLPNLPSINDVDAMRLKNWFPYRSVPFHVWIDKDGIIKLMGPAENTNRKKINSFLQGNEITFLKDQNSTPRFSTYCPYYKVIGKTVDVNSKNSFITPYNNEYAGGWFGGIAEGVVDSTQHTIRDTYINIQVADLYQRVLSQNNRNKNLIYQNVMKIPFCLFFVNDTSKYSNSLTPPLRVTDVEIMQSRVCYEQILPMSSSEAERKTYMLQKLNEYFEQKDGLNVTVEKIKTQCYVLKQIDANKFVSTGKKSQIDTLEFKDLLSIRYDNYFLSSIINNGIESFLRSNRGQEIILFNETGYTGTATITLPARINTIDEFSQALRSNGLDLIKAELELQYLVFKEKNYKLIFRNTESIDAYKNH